MKQKDIEKRLKNEAEQFVPDPLEKIKTAAWTENLLPNDSDRNLELYCQGNTAVAAKSKRKPFLLFGVITSIIVCFVLILSFTLNTVGNKPLVPTDIHLSAEDVYGMGAVSSVRLLGNNLPTGAIQSFSEVAHATSNYAVADKSEDDAKRQARRFNEYFTALDSFLGEDIISTVTEKNTNVQYSYEDRMTITGKDFNGKTVTYTMYYTETLEKTESADEDEETEKEYRLVGVMVIDGVDYYLEGERSEETEKDETETELKIRAYADKTDKTSYIQMEQEYSAEDGETETEYVYSIYVNGDLIEQTSVEFETENKDGKAETEYELEFRSGSTKGKYVVEREVKNSKSEIKVKYEIDGKTGVFHIREITDESGNKKYEYTFSDNEKMVF